MSEGRRGATGVSHEWDAIEPDHPARLTSRQLIRGERMMVGRFVVEEGFHVEPHVHHNEQITLVIEGCLRFRVGTVGSDEMRDEEVGPGQVMVLPPFVPHGITALENSLAIDIFSPTSEKTGLDQD